MLGMDEPVHGRLRALVSKAFSQKALARWQDEIGRPRRQRTDRQVRRERQGRLGQEVHLSDIRARIIAGLLGLPEEDYPQFQRWSISLLSLIMNPERGLAGVAGAVEYFAPILAARRAEPRDDLISRLAAAEIDGEQARPTRRSSRSCGCCCPPAWRPPTGRWATCSSGCSPTPTQLEAVRADRSLHSAGHRGGGAVGAAAADHHPGRHLRHRTGRRADSARAVR